MSRNKKDKDPDEFQPSWVSAENDDKLRDEIAPLLGSGAVALEDAAAASSQSAQSSATAEQGYGSILSAFQHAPPPASAPPPPPPTAAGVTTTTTTREPVSAADRLKAAAAAAFRPKARAATGTAPDDDEDDNVILVEKAPSQFVKGTMVDPETLKPHQPGQNACLWLFHLLEGIAVTASLCLMVTQVLPFVLSSGAESSNHKTSSSAMEMDILSMALRIYITIFCILFILTETQAPIPGVRQSQLLQTYASRGFLYSFIGLICVEEAYSERVKGIVSHADDSFHIGWASVFMEVSSWLMLSTGAVYAFLGLFCCKRLRDKMKRNEIDAWKRYKEDMAAWKQRFT